MVGNHRGQLRPGDRSFPRGESRNGRLRPSHLPGKRLNNLSGAGWRVRTTFLGAVRSLWGLSLSRLVGFGIWLPPTYVGARDHRPTAVSAPRFMLDGFSDWRRLELDQRRSEGGSAPRRSCPASSGRTRRDPRSQEPPIPGGTGPRAPLASVHCFGLSSAARRAGYAPAFDHACRRRIRDRPAGSRWPGIAANLSPLATRGTYSRRRNVDSRTPRGGARR
jgi:hypothetical protein